ncbi:hypothetical protein ACFS5L_04125, partial [Streptomyces phyllanthi]
GCLISQARASPSVRNDAFPVSGQRGRMIVSLISPPMVRSLRDRLRHGDSSLPGTLAKRKAPLPGRMKDVASSARQGKALSNGVSIPQEIDNGCP